MREVASQKRIRKKQTLNRRIFYGEIRENLMLGG